MGKQWKEVQSEEDIEKLTARLPMIGGIPPERYMPIAVAVFLFVLFGIVLVVPGLTKYGTRLTVRTAPSGASVYLDERRLGPAPVKVFVPAGDYQLTVRFPGLAEYREPISLSGRRIGSALFPLRRTVDVPLRRPAPPAPSAPPSPTGSSPLSELLVEYHQWALAGPPGEQFQHPPVGRILARSLWAQTPTPPTTPTTPNDPTWRSTMESLVSGASSSQTPDLLGAVLRSSVPGAALHVGQLAKAVQLFIQLDNDYQGFYRVLGDITSGTAAAGPVQESSWYRTRQEAQSTELLATSLELDERGPPRQSIHRFGGIPETLFVRVPEGNYLTGYPLRDRNDIGLYHEFTTNFYIAATEVSEREYARFLGENEMWRPSARERLVAAGLVDTRYLQHWPDDGAWVDDAEFLADRPVRNVSWYAAQAYIEWLSQRIKTAGAPLDGHPAASLRVALPSADDWEYAAFLNALGPADQVFNTADAVAVTYGRPGALGAYHLSGNVWEWTDDWYTRNGRSIPSHWGSQRAVIGGSYANTPVPPGTVGGQPPDWCTPFLGFRPAIYIEYIEEEPHE